MVHSKAQEKRFNTDGGRILKMVYLVIYGISTVVSNVFTSNFCMCLYLCKETVVNWDISPLLFAIMPHEKRQVWTFLCNCRKIN